MKTRSITRSEEKEKRPSIISESVTLATDSRIVECEYRQNYVALAKELEVNIDFDEASAAWRANKKSTGNGCYKYICEHKNKKNIKCGNNPVLGVNFCSRHNI
jgi:hypothetical protein